MNSTKSNRVLIIGAGGRLGRDLVEVMTSAFEIIPADRKKLDITDADAVLDFVRGAKPRILLHAAAIADVDRCEGDPATAMAVNAIGTENVANACRQTGAWLIYFSTDYVFDGRKTTPYSEDDTPNPLSVYGQSKLEGEKRVTGIAGRWTILRVAWLYGRHGTNFVKNIIAGALKQQKQIAKNRPGEPLLAVDDQIGTPTWAADVARQVIEIIKVGLEGLFHCTALGQTSRYQLAKEIVTLLDLKADIKPCRAAEFFRLAQRPAYSVLNNRRLEEAGICVMRHYREALAEFLTQYRGELLSQVAP